jgi:hypothetical protein
MASGDRDEPSRKVLTLAKAIGLDRAATLLHMCKSIGYEDAESRLLKASSHEQRDDEKQQASWEDKASTKLKADEQGHRGAKKQPRKFPSLPASTQTGRSPHRGLRPVPLTPFEAPRIISHAETPEQAHRRRSPLRRVSGLARDAIPGA